MACLPARPSVFLPVRLPICVSAYSGVTLVVCLLPVARIMIVVASKQSVKSRSPQAIRNCSYGRGCGDGIMLIAG